MDVCIIIFFIEWITIQFSSQSFSNSLSVFSSFSLIFFLFLASFPTLILCLNQRFVWSSLWNSSVSSKGSCLIVPVEDEEACSQTKKVACNAWSFKDKTFFLGLHRKERERRRLTKRRDKIFGLKIKTGELKESFSLLQ